LITNLTTDKLSVKAVAPLPWVSAARTWPGGCQQGVWLEISLDGGGVKDEVDGLGRVALVDLEASR